MELFRGYHARRKGEFVIESDYPPESLPRSMITIAASAISWNPDQLAALERRRLKDAASHVA